MHHTTTAPRLHFPPLVPIRLFSTSVSLFCLVNGFICTIFLEGRILFLMLFYDCLLQIYRHTIDFWILIFHPAILLNKILKIVRPGILDLSILCHIERCKRKGVEGTEQGEGEGLLKTLPQIHKRAPTLLNIKSEVSFLIER